MEYTKDQIEDIKKRESRALEMLKELQLSPAVSMQMENIGGDRFAIKPYPYLQDLKYNQSPIKSPDEFLPPESTTA